MDRKPNYPPTSAPNKVPPSSYADDPKKGGYRDTPTISRNMKPDPKIKVK